MSLEETFQSWAQSLDQTERVKCDTVERAIKRAIKTDKTLATMNIDVKPHGSYQANTSIRQDSDVDIYVCLRSTFCYNLPHRLSVKPEDISGRDTSITYKAFRKLVEYALIHEFGKKSITRGGKAFDIHEKPGRIDADVIAAFEYRFYTGQYHADGIPAYHMGITFFPDSGGQVINWPDQTYENGIQKNNETRKRYKAVIRILKNLRNKMQEDKITQANSIASFLIESLVWNVPNEGFGHAHLSDDVQYALAYCFNNTRDNENPGTWHEVNELKHLFKQSQPWTKQQAHQFVSSTWDYVGFT